MIKINDRNIVAFHTLYANKDLKSMGEVWKKGEMKKDCWVQIMSDGRVSVMGNVKYKPDPKGSGYPIAEYDFFYKVFANMEEVHKTFNEQTTIEQAAA